MDDEIDFLKKEIESKNKELIEDIHQHAVLNNQLQQEIVETNQQVKHVVKEIKEIQVKAE